jgi:putative DNA primase/helicase
MPAAPTVVTDDTREWRRESDLILRWFDDNLIPDPAFYISGTEHYDAFAEWLAANGHQKWTAQTFAERFEQHDEIAARGIVHRRVWQPSTPLTASRRNTFKPLPQRFRAWVGVRFRTDADDRAEMP